MDSELDGFIGYRKLRTPAMPPAPGMLPAVPLYVVASVVVLLFTLGYSLNDLAVSGDSELLASFLSWCR